MQLCALILFVCQALIRWTNRETANRKVITQAPTDTHTNRNEDVWYVVSVSGGAEKG